MAHTSSVPRPQLPLALARLLESISDSVIVLDRDWNFVYLNPRALEESGEGAEAFSGRNLWEKYPALRGTEFERQVRQAMADQVAAHFEFRRVLTGRWLEVHAYPSADTLLIYGRDISDRKRAEEALRASEDRSRVIAELTSDYAYTCAIEPDGTIRLDSVTEGFQRITGYTLEEINARGGWIALIPPEDRPGLLELTRHMLAGESVLEERRIFTKDGRVRWIRYSTRPIWNGSRTRVMALIGAVEDATERHQAEKALRASEERFHSFMDHSPAVAWVKDELLRIVYVNRSWEHRFGRTAAEVCGLTDLDLRPREIGESLREHDRKVLASGTAMEFEEVVPDSDGRPRHWQVAKFPFRDADGARYVGGMAVDITEHIRDQEALRENADRLQTLSRRLLDVQEQERRHLARELHDEIGQLLTGLHLALEQEGVSGAGLEGARDLVKELAGRVRDLSLRLRPTMLDDLGLLPALLWLFDGVNNRTGLQVHFHHSGLTTRLGQPVETAAYRIAQEALTNVTRHAGVKEAWIRAWRANGCLHLQVEDRGAGFDVDGVGARGLSAGLSGMQERAALLGGQLTVESIPGRGTRVAALLPACQADGDMATWHAP
jgi:PAS domain S-box-containing protein